jgi:hypothetical protein
MIFRVRAFDEITGVSVTLFQFAGEINRTAIVIKGKIFFLAAR